MSLPLVIEPTMQKYSGDCALTCLCMLLEASYFHVRGACGCPKKAQVNGLNTRQILRVARNMGHQLRHKMTQEWPEDDEIGIAGVFRVEEGFKRKYEGHAVMFIRGCVYNPSNGLLYTSTEAFEKETGWKIEEFYWRES